MPRPCQSLLRCGMWLSSCLLIVGCGSPVAEDAPTGSITTVAPVPPEAESVLPTATGQGEAIKETATADAIDPAPLTEQPAPTMYIPPFPDRDKLFAAPRRSSSGLSRRRGDQQDTVELIGFVNVGGPKAVLSIDGLISPIASGESRHGIEVISIQPPTVVWQRRGVRDHASLEN